MEGSFPTPGTPVKEDFGNAAGSSSANPELHEGAFADDQYNHANDQYDDDAAEDDYWEQQEIMAEEASASLGNLLTVLQSSTSDDASLELALSELCNILSLATEDSIANYFDQQAFIPALINFLGTELPDLRLLAVRTITYIADVSPITCGSIVMFGGIPALCICALDHFSIDVSEEALHALHNISKQCSRECLHAGALAAVLGHLDFFPTATQRVALATALNVCRALSCDADAAQFALVTVPILMGILASYSHDARLLENSAKCLSQIVECSGPKSLNKIFASGLVSLVLNLISGNDGGSSGILEGSSYIVLVDLLSSFAKSSLQVTRELLKTGVSGVLKDALRRDSGVGLFDDVDLHVTVALANKLLPPLPQRTSLIYSSVVGPAPFAKRKVVTWEKYVEQVGVKITDHEKLLRENPQLLMQFAGDLLPVLIELGAASGVGVRVREQVAVLIRKLFWFCSEDSLKTFMETINVAGYLARVLIFDKDVEVLILGLEISEILMEKLPDICINLFTKEGIFHAIENLIPSGNVKNWENKRALNRKRPDLEPSSSPLEYLDDSVGPGVHAIRFTDAYLDHRIFGHSQGFFNLQNLCRQMWTFLAGHNPNRKGERINVEVQPVDHILNDILLEFSAEGCLSTFEVFKSGVVGCLLKYFQGGAAAKRLYEKKNKGEYYEHLLKRFSLFLQISLAAGTEAEKSPLKMLVRKLQDALSFFEEFELASDLSSNYRAINNRDFTSSFLNKMINPFRGSKNPEVGTSTESMQLVDSIAQMQLPCKLEKTRIDFTYDILLLLKILQAVNRLAPDLRTKAMVDSFANGKVQNLNELKLLKEDSAVSHEEFWNSKLTMKLERQMLDIVTTFTGNYPSWCHEVTKACSFLFPFETKRKFFLITSLGAAESAVQHLNDQFHDLLKNHNLVVSKLPRWNVSVAREDIKGSLESVMGSPSIKTGTLDAKFIGEEGFGLGPTLEFYTLAAHEFQKKVYRMWRDFSIKSVITSSDEQMLDIEQQEVVEEFIDTSLLLFPRPYLAGSENFIETAKVMKNFTFLGRLMAKAVHDGRLLDIPLSKAFYKLILGEKLSLHDIRYFDPRLESSLQEMLALANRKKVLDSAKDKLVTEDLCYHGVKMEDLGINFTLPGFPELSLKPGGENIFVDLDNMEEYVSLIVEATVNTGVRAQAEAFKEGFNEVIPISSLQIFSEDELDYLFCGIKNHVWNVETLGDCIVYDHGYSSESPQMKHFLDILSEFDSCQQQAFLQFVTGSPRLPPGGLSALSPRLTVVLKHSDDSVLPSAMTCTNYLKLPPYTTKDIMRDRLLYAITQGKTGFALS